ncbi:hypothetical protein [Escherichia albertii]
MQLVTKVLHLAAGKEINVIIRDQAGNTPATWCGNFRHKDNQTEVGNGQ